MRIAAFDSGVGGLTALAPLFKKYPGVEVTYLGDLAHLPYGTKSDRRIRELVSRNIKWLITKSKESKRPFDLVIVACNTATAHALPIAQKIARAQKIPLVGVIEPGCQAAVLSQKKRVVVLATSSTVQSGAYLDELYLMGCKKPVVQKACPLFVPLVEENLQKSPAAEWIAKHYLGKLLTKNDAVILGCTHYPFLVPTLVKLFPKVEWIDAGGALVHDPIVIDKMKDQRRTKKASKLKVYFTDHSTSRERLESFARALGLQKIKIELEYIPAQ